METNYFKIIFNYINGLRKYRWFHIAICIEFVFLVIALVIKIGKDIKAYVFSVCITYPYLYYNIFYSLVNTSSNSNGVISALISKNNPCFCNSLKCSSEQCVLYFVFLLLNTLDIALRNG